jgi:hypothetical protein
MSDSTRRRLNVRAFCVCIAALGFALALASAALAEEPPPDQSAPPAATTPATPEAPAPDPPPTAVKPDPAPVSSKPAARPKPQPAPAVSPKPVARPAVTATPSVSSSSSARVAASSAAVARSKATAKARAKAKAKAAAKRAEARKRAARIKARAARKAPKPKVAPPPVAAADANDSGAPWLELLIPFGLLCLGVGAVALWSRRRRDPVEDVPVVAPAAATPGAPIAAPMPVAPVLEPEPFDEFVTEEAPFVADDEPEVCTIRAWRGYLKWQFYATVRRGGVDYPAGESKVFRSSGNGIPDETPAARAAYDALVAKLARDGWTTSESAVEGWYADRLVRSGSDTPAPAGEDVFDVGPLLAGHEDEEPVALPDDGATARGNGVAVAMDDGDQRVPG